MAAPDNAKRVEEAKKLAKDQPSESEKIYKEVLDQGPGQTDASVRNYDAALMGLGELYRDQKRTNDLAQLVQQTRSHLSSFAKARTAKLGKKHHMLRTGMPALTVIACSPSTPRPLQQHSQLPRNSHRCHKVVHRLGRL